jgi:energy-coupling factor transport system ATP-binding protein
LAACITIENLTYVYGAGTPFEVRAVDNVNVEIEKGALTGLIGHTGSGKSTLLQHLNGLLKPTSGKILLNGEDIWETPKKIRAVRFKVGLVFQYPEYQLFEETVQKDVAFGPQNMGLSKSEVDDRVREAVALVGLSESVLTQSPFELSGGEKRRVAIAGVMAMRPEVLILDEPTAGLDPVGREEMLQNIKRYQEEGKRSVVFVTHNMNDIAKVAKNIIVMDHGKVVLAGDLDEVFSKKEELIQMGLDIPDMLKLQRMLETNGLSFEKPVYTVSAMLEALSAMKGGGRHA